jgi:hypothetical protein
VLAFIVTPGAVNVPPANPVMVGVGLPPVTQKVPEGYVNAALSKGVTFTVAVLEQPLLSVYVIVVDPPETPVTNPVEFTVATAVFDDVHGLTDAGVPLPVS